MRSTDLFSFPTLQSTRPLLDQFSSSLRLSTCLNHLFNICCYLLVNNFWTGHFAFLFRDHSYLQCTFSSCCIVNTIFSISARISLSSLSIFYFLFFIKSSIRPCSWPSIAISLHLQTIWLFTICFTPCNSLHGESHSIHFHLKRIPGSDTTLAQPPPLSFASLLGGCSTSLSRIVQSLDSYWLFGSLLEPNSIFIGPSFSKVQVLSNPRLSPFSLWIS